MEIVIRADGGPDLGYGHLVRTGALARRFVQGGHRVTYATTTPDAVEQVCPVECDVVSLSDRCDADVFLDELGETPDTSVVDSYVIDVDYQRTVRDVSRLVMVSDTARSVCADALVNGNLYAAELSYEVVGAEPDWYLGTDYVLLRDRIASLARSEPPWREPPKRAIVVLGGSDEAEMTPTVVRAFDGVNVAVEAIVGPGCLKTQERAVKRAADETNAAVSVRRDPEDLPRRMFEADFAVSTTSTTTYELLAVGTPLVGFPVVDNQERIATALDERAAASVLSRRPSREQIASSIRELALNSRLRRRLRRMGRSLVDGNGVERVYTELISSRPSN